MGSIVTPMPRSEIFYVSNLISLSRFVLLGVMLYFLLGKDYLPAGIMLVIIWFSDLLDGFVARKRNEISELGKIIDPLADKVTIISIVIVLLIQNILPLWFVLVILFRDVIIFTGGLFLKKQKGVVLPSNRTGKIAVFIIGLTVLFSITKIYITSNYAPVNVELFSGILVFSSIGMSIISLIAYYIKFKNALKN